MANRYPLIIDTADGNKVKELPSGDNLYLRNNSIQDVQDINALGTINAAAITIAGERIVAQSFTDLTDTPNTFFEQGGKFVKVKADETGLEFASLGGLGNITVQNVTVNNGSIFPNEDVRNQVGKSDKRFWKMHAESFYGSLRGNDGTLVFDATTNRIPYAAIFGAPTALSELTNDMGFVDATNVESVVLGILDNYDDVVRSDLIGSVFGDDSTLLIDGLNSSISTHALAQVGATNGQALVWSDLNQRWQPGTVSGGGGGVDLTAFSVGPNAPASGSGNLSYNNTTGVFTYTPPDLTTFGAITADSITADSLEFTGVGVVTIESGSNLVLNAANGAGNIVASGSRITNVADPIGLQDAATKSYVDAVFLGGGVAFFEGDMKGSVFADDSSLIIDGINKELRVNKITYGDSSVVSYQDNTSCPAGTDTVIYTSTGSLQHAIRLFVIIEGLVDGDDPVNWQTQACDVIAVKGYVDDVVHVSAYGVTYSSATAFATFDGQWNPTTNRIEITCRPVSTTNSVVASVHALEMQSND